MSEELIINDANFDQYFKDVRIHLPERGDVMAKYTAVAELIEGKLKSDIVDLLTNYDNKTLAATQVMRKLGHASAKDSILVCKQILQDYIDGMSVDEIIRKPYKYVVELFYYTKKQYIPVDNPHWVAIGIENLEEFYNQNGNILKISSKKLDAKPEQNNCGQSISS